MVRAVALANLGDATANIRCFSGWGRRHISPPESITQRRVLVRPTNLDISISRLYASTGMVGDESAQAGRRSLLAQELGTVNGVESSPTDRRRIADVVQPGRGKQQVCIINYIYRLSGLSSDALNVLPPSRHTDKTFLGKPRSPGDEVFGHRCNRNASLNGSLRPQSPIGDQ